MSALTDVFTAIANAIRSKKGVSTTYKPSEMASAISSISTGTDTSDATLDSGSRMLSGYTAYAKGTKYSGSITQRSASTETISSSRTYDSGYYPNSWTLTPQSSGYRIASGTFTPSSSATSVNVGFKPKKLFIYYSRSTSYVDIMFYDENLSTTHYQRSIKSNSEGQGACSWKALGSASTGYLTSIDSNGFTVAKVTASLRYEHKYVAIA